MRNQPLHALFRVKHQMREGEPLELGLEVVLNLLVMFLREITTLWRFILDLHLLS